MSMQGDQSNVASSRDAVDILRCRRCSFIVLCLLFVRDWGGWQKSSFLRLRVVLHCISFILSLAPNDVQYSTYYKGRKRLRVCRAVLFIISFIIRFPILSEARYSLREERSADFPTQDLVAEVQNNGMATNYTFFFFISPISINRAFQ